MECAQHQKLVPVIEDTLHPITSACQNALDVLTETVLDLKFVLVTLDTQSKVIIVHHTVHVDVKMDVVLPQINVPVKLVSP
jgi:hypothetical protein